MLTNWAKNNLTREEAEAREEDPDPEMESKGTEGAMSVVKQGA